MFLSYRIKCFLACIFLLVTCMSYMNLMALSPVFKTNTHTCDTAGGYSERGSEPQEKMKECSEPEQQESVKKKDLSEETVEKQEKYITDNENEQQLHLAERQDSRRSSQKNELGRSEPVSDEDIKGFKSYVLSSGVIANTAAIGWQIEYRFIPPVGIKFMYLYVFGLAADEGQHFLDIGEFLVAGLLAPSFHIPIKGNRFDPYIFLGVLYSHFHWKHDRTDTKGDIRDLTFGGGIGLGIRLTTYLDIGFNIWCDYDYKVNRTLLGVEKGNRLVLVMPYVSVNFLY